MASYDDMMAQMQQDRRDRLERTIREAAFEDEHATCLAFPTYWKDKMVQRRLNNPFAQAEVEVDGIIAIFITGEDERLGRVCRIDTMPDHLVLELVKFQWVIADPLPPLVVLAKCSEGNLSTDRASKEWED